MFKGLVVIDVDSTLIKEEVIDFLGEKVGASSKMKEITEAAMSGRIDFRASLKERVALLKGLPIEEIESIKKGIHLNRGARKLINKLKSEGYQIGVISGGFHELVDSLAQDLSIELVRANHLEVENGMLTGRLIGDIIDAQEKLATLKKWANRHEIDLSRTIAIGDGANDLLMLKGAGLGVGFCAKEVVQKEVLHQIKHQDLYQLISIMASQGF
ncbi:phosphoserine phosphatase SerB [Streptococcus ictaluri]|uniref:phosphoserine phosphatase n=1 Tax=Streptococcus ictaluri 707-05 TaxID=764299 RepID=G5K419_9STRE|nr:phosphoserine phosphatase SerB [Streptococcus ictaluri]EHI69622.1 phosphoserine phosphatase SerB [Streptococcus ictaluri 707-05]